MFYIQQQKLNEKINILTKQAKIYKKQADKNWDKSQKRMTQNIKFVLKKNIIFLKNFKNSLKNCKMHSMNWKWTK